MLWLLLIVLVLSATLFWTLKNGIGPMPTSLKVRNYLLAHLPSDFDGSIIDAGSGWGSLVFPLAKKFPNKRIIGYETSPLPYLYGKLRQLFSSSKNIELKYADFWHKPFNGADLVVCYLYSGAMPKIKEKCFRELKSGSWIVSNTFALPHMEPTDIHEVNDVYHTKIYFYRIP